MLQTPAEVYFEGLIEMAARRGLKTIAVLYEDTLFPNAVAQDTVSLARKRGLQPVVVEAYPRKTTDFAPLLARVKAAAVDVVAAATYFDDSVAITRQMQSLDVNPKTYGLTIGVDLPKFYETLGRQAEFVYGASQWDPSLVTLRAGAWFRWRASTLEQGNSSPRIARSSPQPTSPIRPRRDTPCARSFWRPSSGPDRSTARNSGT
jgi:ABC-type branched-subunit amino acid transport system substrate-binding protein